MHLLPYRAPYDWTAIAAWLGARAIAGVETVEADWYARGGAVVRHAPERSALLVSGTRDDAKRARRLFDVDADARAIGRLLGRDPLLAPLVRRRRGIRVPGAWDPFELAVRAIVGQQVSVAAARTILGRIATAHGFAPETLAMATIEGMPRKRADTIRVFANAVVDGSVVLARGDSLEETIDMLTALPGIGPWTAHYIAMRALGERDAFPAGDLILRRNAGNLSERELLRRAEAWRPFRAYAAMLLWTR
ncbi:MAG TPA: AlkA N-terminal domain-containing protein [Thermoanaerobaculia bacterium]|nr:AlkA N-terminal domain-containing protein [Thermoanaerobaculia bacterium]